MPPPAPLEAEGGGAVDNQMHVTLTVLSVCSLSASYLVCAHPVMSQDAARVEFELIFQLPVGFVDARARSPHCAAAVR